jgi:lipopolysaccharide export system permease protein
MQFVWKYVDDLVGKGLEWFIILKLLGLVSVTMVSLALPLAVLLSSLMAFGNLGEYMELTALKASGISLQRAMRPVFLFCMVLSVTAFYFSNNLLPIANLKMKTLLNDISHKRPELNIKPGIFNNDIENYVIRIGEKSSDGKVMKNIMIYDHSKHAGNDRLIIAERGKMSSSADQRYLELRLYNGNSYTEAEVGQRKKNTFPFLRESFSEDLIRFDLSIFKLSTSDESLYKNNYQMLNLSQLTLASDTLKQELYKEKAFLPSILFRGAFFIKGKSYSKTPKETGSKPVKQDSVKPAKEMALQDSILRDSPDGQIAKQAMLRSIRRQAGFQNIDSGISISRPVFVEVPLKSRTDVLLNFNRADRIRILEAAENSLRANKSTLDYSVQNFEQEQEQIFKHEIEWHRKFTLSFACLLLFLIGAPLGAIVRKGGLGLPVVFSLIFFIVYHMISITGEKLAREGVTSAFWGMWLSSAILLPVGLFLTWKSTRDSALFDKEAYLKVFMAVKGFVLKISRK